MIWNFNDKNASSLPALVQPRCSSRHDHSPKGSRAAGPTGKVAEVSGSPRPRLLSAMRQLAVHRLRARGS